MPDCDMFTALRDFKVRTSTMENFLLHNGKAHGTLHAPIYHWEDQHGPDDVSALLRAKAGGSSGVLYVIPAVKYHDETPYVYVAYQHRHFYSQLRITQQEPPDQPVSAEFEKLRQDVLRFRAGSVDGASQGISGRRRGRGSYGPIYRIHGGPIGTQTG